MTATYSDFVAAEIAKLVPVATTPEEATGYGADLACISDVDANLVETDPATTATLAQDAFHRITTPREGLPDDPDYGIDVAEFLSQPTDETTLLMQSGLIRLELLKDDRFSIVEVEGAATGAKLATRVFTITITPEDPALVTFTMIVNVAQAGATLETV